MFGEDTMIPGGIWPGARPPTVHKRFRIVRRAVVRMAATSRITQRGKVGLVNAHANSRSRGVAAGGIETMWASLAEGYGLFDTSS